MEVAEGEGMDCVKAIIERGIVQGKGWYRCEHPFHLIDVYMPMGRYWGSVPIREEYVRVPPAAAKLATLRAGGWQEFEV